MSTELGYGVEVINISAILPQRAECVLPAGSEKSVPQEISHRGPCLISRQAAHHIVLLDAEREPNKMDH